MPPQLLVKDKSETNRYLKVSPFRKGIRKTEPHTHNSYFEIIYLTQGSGHHFIDSIPYLVAPPVMHFVRQEQVHHWDLDDEPDGFVIIIKKAFMDNGLDHELKNLIGVISNYASLNLTNDSTIHALFELLIAENKPDNENALTIIEGLLKALLAKVLRIAQPYAPISNAKLDLFQSFQSLLHSEQKVKNNVEHYAGLLHTTPQNLNKVCRKAAQQSAAEVISSFIIAEAKRLLVYTNSTVSSISFALDFNDPSHFIKYFKRSTGTTPQAYRTSLNKPQ